MVQQELADDEAELIEAVRTLKTTRGVKRLPRRGEFGKLVVEWTHTGLKVDLDHSLLIK
jgi:hypothetical protein